MLSDTCIENFLDPVINRAILSTNKNERDDLFRTIHSIFCYVTNQNRDISESLCRKKNLLCLLQDIVLREPYWTVEDPCESCNDPPAGGTSENSRDEANHVKDKNKNNNSVIERLICLSKANSKFWETKLSMLDQVKVSVINFLDAHEDTRVKENVESQFDGLALRFKLQSCLSIIRRDINWFGAGSPKNGTRFAINADTAQKYRIKTQQHKGNGKVWEKFVKIIPRKAANRSRNPDPNEVFLDTHTIEDVFQDKICALDELQLKMEATLQTCVKLLSTRKLASQINQEEHESPPDTATVTPSTRPGSSSARRKRPCFVLDDESDDSSNNLSGSEQQSDDANSNSSSDNDESFLQETPPRTRLLERSVQRRSVRRRTMWTVQESNAIKAGVATGLVGQWMAMKNMFPEILKNRTNVQIKDKYRTMLRAGEIYESGDVNSSSDND